MAKLKKCEDCYYGRPAVREGLTFCSYVADVMAMDGNKAGYDMKLAQQLVKTIGFNGDVYEGYVDMLKDTTVPVLAPVVSNEGHCRKFRTKVD